MPVYEFDGSAPTVPAAGRYWIAPDADLIGKVVLEEDTSIWFGAVLRGDIEPITIGARSNVQDLSVMHTDGGFPLTVGPDCTIGHRAILHGCTVGPNTLIGMGAVILTGARIGANCLVAAHALVPERKEIPDGSLVVGVPGKVVRALSPAEIADISAAKDRYLSRWRIYAGDRFKAVVLGT
jgi:carbonic anhydrase/acetyltransferase-like protein (isoleucine patch superfamily)